MKINAEGMHFSALDKAVRESADKNIEIQNCIGQRYLAAGLSGKNIAVCGTPGNALGAYLNGARLDVFGNVQEATGDTMNAGTIAVHGSAGDATGYAMRGGKIFIEGDVGYRCGIHMKAYKENKPAIVVGGRAGSFLGEYQAGGTIVVLGENRGEKPIVGYFCGTGMHGGEMFLRCAALPVRLPAQVKAEKQCGLHGEARELAAQWCEVFGRDAGEYLDADYFRLTPDSENPYKQMYTAN